MQIRNRLVESCTHLPGGAFPEKRKDALLLEGTRRRLLVTPILRFRANRRGRGSRRGPATPPRSGGRRLRG
jgi:hypothetical protein